MDVEHKSFVMADCLPTVTAYWNQEHNTLYISGNGFCRIGDVSGSVHIAGRVTVEIGNIKGDLTVSADAKVKSARVQGNVTCADRCRVEVDFLFGKTVNLGASSIKVQGETISKAHFFDSFQSEHTKSRIAI